MDSVSIEALCCADFAAHVDGSPFTVMADNAAPIVLALTSAVELPKGGPNPLRKPFSLCFTDQAASGILPQQIYRLAHEVMGELEIFIVPVGQDESGVTYQAVFN